MQHCASPHHHHPHPLPPVDRCAHECDDQLPIFSRVGRGPKGDSFYATIDQENGVLIVTDQDGNQQQYPLGNGKLTCAINYNLENNPQTFSMTFVYKEGEVIKWEVTTPNIPFYGQAGDADPYAHVKTIYIMDLNNPNPDWAEYNEYSDDWPVGRAHPQPGDDWVPCITVGSGPTEVGGQMVYPDIIIPNTDDLLQHFHNDLGWGNSAYGDDGKQTHPNTVKEYIEDMIGTALAPIYNILGDILDHIWGVTYDTNPVTGFIDPASITWPEYSAGNDMNIPMADLNIFAAEQSPVNATKANSIRSRDLSDNDLKAV